MVGWVWYSFGDYNAYLGDGENIHLSSFIRLSNRDDAGKIIGISKSCNELVKSIEVMVVCPVHGVSLALRLGSLDSWLSLLDKPGKVRAGYTDCIILWIIYVSTSSTMVWKVIPLLDNQAITLSISSEEVMMSADLPGAGSFQKSRCVSV
jgi:hypothetical protein